MTARPLAALLALALLAGGCAAGGAGGARAPRTPRGEIPPPAADSVTVALWRFDETGGAQAPDAGPFRLAASVGVDTRSEFGRFRGGRRFTRTVESFAVVPYNPVMESDRGFTIEAWVRLDAYGQYELTPIAGRWNEVANEQSWLLAVVGRKISPAFASLPSPGYFSGSVVTAQTGRLLLLLQPEQAAGQQAYAGSVPIRLDTWTHVAASWDGQVVRLYVDGQIDSQYALEGRVRRSPAALLVGNYFDTRRLTDFSGQLQLDAGVDRNPYYALEGVLDEVRLSSVARTRFESSPTR
jgi:hypothetical protein